MDGERKGGREEMKGNRREDFDVDGRGRRRGKAMVEKMVLMGGERKKGGEWKGKEDKEGKLEKKIVC